MQGVFGREGTVRVIRISAHGSHTAFESLAEGQADIAMSTREITQEEYFRLRILANMSGSLKEEVLALDGIAIIVNPTNPLVDLSKDQTAAVFSGLISDWRQLNHNEGKINVYIPDDKGDTFHAFKAAVLGNAALTVNAQRYRDASQVAEAVAHDADGIGFVSISSIGNAKAVAISAPGSVLVFPDLPSIAAGRYPVSRRLYLYSFDGQENPYLRKFFDFAYSEKGQELISQRGFVALGATRKAPGLGETTGVDRYAQLTANALRLSFDIRFPPGSAALDHAAVGTIERAVEFLNTLGPEGRLVMLFGFADARGDVVYNLQVSKKRAEMVAKELKRRGISPAVIDGWGALQPVASNDTKQGRDQNRRVEIWLK
ncbi:MAG: phosphate ABC transporter substrate-binding/OmpA family protein [Gammaproteobacteria bacterium]